MPIKAVSFICFEFLVARLYFTEKLRHGIINVMQRGTAGKNVDEIFPCTTMLRREREEGLAKSATYSFYLHSVLYFLMACDKVWKNPYNEH